MKITNPVIFIAELIGTFGLVVSATGSIVYDGRQGETLGPIFIAVIHFVGIAIVIYAFGKYSMAHFNPAVTVGFLLAGYVKPKALPIYFGAQIIGAVLGSLFVKYVFGDYSQLGLNYPNYEFSLSVIFGVEIIATVFVMGIILLVVHFKKLNKIPGAAISGIIALDVFYLGPISGASMNPIRSFAPALITGIFDDLWIYWTAPFVAVMIVGLIYRKNFSIYYLKKK